MKSVLAQFACVGALMAGCPLSVMGAAEAVLLHLENDLQQVRVEARDAESGRWLAVASGYRDPEASGWLKIAVPEGYAESELRVMGSAQPSPFSGSIASSGDPETLYVEYPPAMNRFWAGGPETTDGGGEPVIEEADVWSWNGDTLFFYNQYRGLQVIDMADPQNPAWLDYFRYPARGEDLYAFEDGTVVLIGTGQYGGDQKVALKFLNFDGSFLNLEDTVELEAGYYMDSRRYNDYLYVMTREWVEGQGPDGERYHTPLVRLYTVALDPNAAERVVDVQTFQGEGWLDAVLTAQPDGILLALNTYQRANSPSSRRWHSDVHVLVPGEDGVPVLQGVAPLSGVVHDKFKMRYQGGVLTAISQEVDWGSRQFTRNTKFENFRLGDSGFVPTGSLDLAPGETLFATRFHGDTVYVVTFLFVDPLFAIDNSNPEAPVIAGELEVPGWSNYIEWVDDRLFAVGIEEQKLSVSIFDVADPANMSLQDRVFLNEDSWAHSEAQYDDQAISFFPEERLLMLPFTTWAWTSEEPVKAMQLVSWDDEGLQLRGAIAHLDVPRRGTLRGDTVVTISGREVVATDVSDPDLPVFSGKAPLAWNAQQLVLLEDHIIQLETSSGMYDWWGWRGPYGLDTAGPPRLYVTSREAPNVPAAEVELEEGRILGAVYAGGYLVLLQDLTEFPEGNYWDIPERQRLAVRSYQLADPLSPELMDEALLEDVAYLGSSFEAHVQPDGSILWASDGTPFYGIFLDAWWPGPWSYNTSLSYLVNRLDNTGSVEVSAWDRYTTDRSWNAYSGWFWESPLLIGSLTEYIEEILPEERPRYESRTSLVAVDFSIPDEPLELPVAELPANLVAVESLEDGMNHYLYFEPRWNVVEVWGWDEASVFKLFQQELYAPDWTNTSTHSVAWMPPFHLRQRSDYADGRSTAVLEVWQHPGTDQSFERIGAFSFEDTWFGSSAVKEPLFLQTTNAALHVFRGDADAGTFALLDSVSLDFPYHYGLSLDQTVLDGGLAYVPAGLYGVEVLPWMETPETASPPVWRLAEAPEGWSEVDTARWERVSRTQSDAAGALHRLKWLFRPDSLREIDPRAVDGGDFWRGSDWFGWYAHQSRDPRWIYHMEHGELFTYAGEHPEQDGIHYYDAGIGMVWTHPSHYPWLYAYDRGEWLYYLEDSGLNGRRWFYGLRTGWF